MTKPKIWIAHEHIPESYSGTEIWIVIHTKPSQKIDEDVVRQLIESTLETNEYDVEAIE